MTPLRIQGATHIMTAPRGMEGECRDLHIVKSGDCFVSRWEPMPHELAILNAGGSVELWVMGCQPPVFVGAKEPA
jgi:hypothetical protein